MIAQTLPGLTAIRGKKQVAGGGAKSERIRAHIQGMAKSVIVAIFLRQAFTKCLPGATT
jgi:hypothetical protein